MTAAPPPARWALQTVLEGRRRSLVEAGGRLVQQPERGGRREEARKAEPPALPGREQPRRQVGKRGEADRLQAPCNRSPVREPHPEGEVLRDGERRLHGIAMADIVEVGLSPAGPGHGAARGRQQPRQNTQQARLAGAVRPRDERRLAGRERKVEVPEQLAPAAFAGEAARLQHQPPSATAAVGDCTCAAAAFNAANCASGGVGAAPRYRA